NGKSHRAAYYSKGLRRVQGMWGYTLRVLDRDDAHRSGAGMPRTLALTAGIAAVATVAGVMLVATMRPAPEAARSGPVVAGPAEGLGVRARRGVGRRRHEAGQALPRGAQAHVPGGARPEDGPRQHLRRARVAVEFHRGPARLPHRDRARAARMGRRRVPLAD